MMLSKGILVADSYNNCSNRLMINSGSKLAKGLVVDDMRYFDNAYIPKDDWKKLSEEQVKKICSNESCHYNNKISLHLLPNEIIEFFRQLDFSKCKNKNWVREVFENNNKIVSSLNLLLYEFIHQFTNDDFTIHNISGNPPNRLTSSSYFTDSSKKEIRFLGLHIDTSTELIDFKHFENKSKNRIGINIGNESRYLLFINLSLFQIYNMLIQIDEVKPKKITLKNIVPLFFKYFPDYPVLRLTQNPYEMYIVPTDNLIHDGSTKDKEFIDTLISVLGNFNHEKQNAEQI